MSMLSNEMADFRILVSSRQEYQTCCMATALQVTWAKLNWPAIFCSSFLWSYRVNGNTLGGRRFYSVSKQCAIHSRSAKARSLVEITGKSGIGTQFVDLGTDVKSSNINRQLMYCSPCLTGMATVVTTIFLGCCIMVTREPRLLQLCKEIKCQPYFNIIHCIQSCYDCTYPVFLVNLK